MINSIPAIHWFRRDLRIHDHPALVDAITNADRVVPLFVLDPGTEPLPAGVLPAP